MRENILVTGATGTVGRELVPQLVEAGQSVRVVVRDPAKADVDASVEVVQGDLLQPRTLTTAFAGMRKAFILAPGGPDMEKMEMNALVAAEQAGVERIVYLSNFGAGSFEGPMWDAHRANEWRLRSVRAAWTILRPARFMKSTPFVWAGVRDRGRLVEPLGGRKVVMTDPRDVAAVATTCLTTPGHEGRIYELTGEALKGEEIALRLADALGRPVEFVDPDPDAARGELVDAGVPPAIAEQTMLYFGAVRADLFYETSTLADLLGRPPRTYADWLRDNVMPLTA